MNLADKMEIFNDIDDRYILESAPKRLWAYGATRSERIYEDRRLPLMFIETVMSVAAVVLILGGIFIWTLVGKDLLKAGGSDDNESVTSVQENDDTPASVYSEGLKFEFNEEKNAYVVTGIGVCKDTVINVPPTYNGMPVTEIGDRAFDQSALEHVELPSSLRRIGMYAFKDCKKLESIVIPEGVTEIGVAAFSGCELLKEIKIPGSVISIGDSAFRLCYGLEKLVLSEGIEKISSFAFEDCERLENFVIPNSVKEIGPAAFTYCDQLTDMTIPESVTTMRGAIFTYCANLKNVVVNAKILQINSIVFRCDKLESIVLGEGIAALGDTVICELKSLKRVYLPSTVNFIYRSNFVSGDMPDDLEIIYNGTVAQWQAVEKEYIVKLDKPITVHCVNGDCIDGPA